jgi:hypothetical protein
MTNRALLKVSLDVIAKHFFDDTVKVQTAILDSDDLAHGTVTRLIEGEGLPPAPNPGMRYCRVNAEVTSHRDEKNLVPAVTRSVRFIPS